MYTINLCFQVFFNIDGYLYVAYGDGSQGDPLYVAQNR